MDAADAVDGMLEAAVVPSFTRVGPAVRSRLDHWHGPAPGDLAGRVVVITGATSGIGLAATRTWLAAGATVEIVARDAAKSARIADSLRAEFPAAGVGTTTADTADLDALRTAAEVLRSRHARIDALVHNAGALDAEHAYAPAGVEQTIASQVVGPFLLSALLFDPLCASEPGRIVWTASGGMYTEPLSVEGLTIGPDGYRGTVAYARAKRAQVTLAAMMADRVDPTRLVVHAMHPGWARTPGVERSLPTFRRITGPLLRSPEQGADTLVWLATASGAPVATTGRFWLDRRPRPIHRLGRTRASDTPAERARLWDWVADAAGTGFPP